MMRMEDFFKHPSLQKTMLKIGDKVRFLNSVGGGIVTSFRGKDVALVADADGFDVPVLITECVVVGEVDRLMENKEPQPYLPPVKTPVSPKEEILQPPKPVEKPDNTLFIETPKGERLNLSLAFLPVEPQSFVQSPFESYLVNESNYYLYFNYMSCQNKCWTSRCHGLIEPDTKLFLEEFQKSDLNELEHLCIQMIAFKEKKIFALKNALTIELRLDTVKFYKLHCFTKNDFFDEDALIIPLIMNDVPERQMLVSVSDIQSALFEREENRRKAPAADKKPKHTIQTLEVDLHINQLVETTAGMSHADMLNCQLSKFHEVMKANAKLKGQRIVFIHGKGEGVLRAAMEKELKTAYKHLCRFQDASFREYGFGATMVVIH